MKYVISESKLINLVDKFISHAFPTFNKEDAEVMKWDNGDEYYIEYFDKKKGGRPFAKYYPFMSQLQLREDVFRALENYLGSGHMDFIIDWFNQEFGQEAENVTF